MTTAAPAENAPAAGAGSPRREAPDALDRDLLNPLLARRDAPGLARFALELSIFAAASVASAALAAESNPLAYACVGVAAVALVTFFPSLHEAGHGTAFSTAWLNEAVVWISAVAMLQAPRFFREFHWEHHRRTQDPLRDPEISGAPSVLDGWPKNLVTYLALVSGQALMLGKLGFTVSCALLPRSARARFFPFLPEHAQRRVAWESRIVVVVLSAACWFGLTRIPGFSAVLLAWPLAHVLLGFYLMPEHTGLPHAGSQCARTRSVESNRAVRWLMWNMPLHTVHHAQPGVPFHNVPALHGLFAPRLEHVTSGYLAFHREALRRIFARS